MMDSATSPSAPRRMTGSGGSAKSESFHFRVTNHNGVWCFVYWSVFDALCIFFILCSEYWLWNDAVPIGY